MAKSVFLVKHRGFLKVPSLEELYNFLESVRQSFAKETFSYDEHLKS